MSENQAPAPEDFNGEVIQQFRANKGTMVSGMFKGAPLLLLSTRGARSGQRRVNPLVYTRDGDRYVIIASKGGGPTHPDWYHNVLANPEVTVEVGPDRFAARAVVVEGAERDRLYAVQAARMPNFAEYEKQTTRRIPVVTLEPVK
ncbi:MAG: nitroreductase family deazaflavin-dependent oxidoreductase [Chloroflexota bacterium]|nr:nitroreductase family deazaflavin-dependent oxidoreductase [Chloroflexota bacterium]